MARQDNDRILVIPDQHYPNHHPDIVPFLAAVKKKYRPTRVVNLGDEVDLHAMSYHDHDPDLPNAGRELKLAREGLQELGKLFPKMVVLYSNHGGLLYRKAKTHGIPKAMLRTPAEYLDLPGWRWVDQLTLALPDGSEVYFHHGKAANVSKLAESEGKHAVQGHYHQRFSIDYWRHSNGIRWAMQCGCLVNRKSRAFLYAQDYRHMPMLGCGLIIKGLPVLVPLVEDKRGRWVGRLP